MQNEMEPGHPRRTRAKQGRENQNPGADSSHHRPRLWLPLRAARQRGGARGLAHLGLGLALTLGPSVRAQGALVSARSTSSCTSPRPGDRD